MFIKRLIPSPVKLVIKSIVGFYRNRKEYSDRKYRPCLYLIGTPEHNNLGDHAIALASLALLNGFSDFELKEISIGMYIYHMLCMKMYMSNDSILFINGGGSMGVEWFYYEKLIRSIMLSFKKRTIVILPQTIYYENSEYGQKEFERSKRIYASHPDLHICAREKYSYDVMKEAYPQNDVLLVPDMVLLLNECKFQNERKGILLCLRNDVESVILPEQIQEITDYCHRLTDKIAITDTVLLDQVSIAERGLRLNQKWEEFSTAELVITDRLHGMVFCAITGTPCIALSNYNHKVKGVYEWIKDLEYIQYLDDYREIPAHIPRLIALKDCTYNAERLRPYFTQIEALLVNGKRTGE